MTRKATMAETCSGADYTKPVIAADLISEWTITIYDREAVKMLALGQVPIDVQYDAQALMRMDEWDEAQANEQLKAVARKRKRRTA